MIMRRAEVWDDAFRKINSNSAAYWLGFTFGGITMRKRGNNYAMTVNSHRRVNIEKLGDFLEYKGKVHKKISKVNKISSYLINISSRNMFEQLNHLGVPPSKRTLSVNFPSLKKSQKLSFIRGYCDNNSNIAHARGDFSQISIGGPKHFLEPMRDFIDIDLNITNTKNLGERIVTRWMSKGVPSKSFALQYSSQTGIKVVRRLYGNINDMKDILHRNRNRIMKVI